MLRLDGLFELVLALTGAALAANIAVAVLVWLYATVYVGGSLVAGLIGAVFIGFGAIIVVGFAQVYLTVPDRPVDGVVPGR